jgi:peroxiredoxin
MAEDDPPGCARETYMGVARMTHLIAPDGKVALRWDDVKVDGHAADVLRAVGGL